VQLRLSRHRSYTGHCMFRFPPRILAPLAYFTPGDGLMTGWIVSGIIQQPLARLSSVLLSSCISLFIHGYCAAIFMPFTDSCKRKHKHNHRPPSNHIYAHTHVHAHVHAHTRAYTCTHADSRTRTRTCTRTRMCIRMHIRQSVRAPPYCVLKLYTHIPQATPLIPNPFLDQLAPRLGRDCAPCAGRRVRGGGHGHGL